MFNKRKKRVNEIVNKIVEKNQISKYIILFIACLIVAFAFNIFFLQNNIVCFGISGLSIVLNQFGITPSIFILFCNMLLILISYKVLGKEITERSIVGSIMFPLCVSITEKLIPYFDLTGVEKIISALMGAFLSGIGYGLVYKSGYTTGGTDIINQIIGKYLHITTCKAMYFTDGLIILTGKLVFPWEIVLYGYLILFIISNLADKVVFGRSKCKTFYIVSEYEQEIKKYLLSIGNGVTVINAKSGVDNDKKNLLLAIVPNKNYYLVRDVIKKMDKDVFYMISDAYETNSKEVLEWKKKN